MAEDVYIGDGVYGLLYADDTMIRLQVRRGQGLILGQIHLEREMVVKIAKMLGIVKDE